MCRHVLMRARRQWAAAVDLLSFSVDPAGHLAVRPNIRGRPITWSSCSRWRSSAL
jgi:hypothetical protein